MNQQELFNLLRTVHSNVRCPQCGRKYAFSDMKIRGVVDSLCFLELHCTDHMPLVATVMIEKKQKNLNQSNSPIMPNDVIETHRALKKFNGNFKKLFDQ